MYARSKLASEAVLEKMASDRFSPVLLRFGTVYGISGRTRFDLVVNLLAAKACIDSQITVYGGDQWRPFLHVDDAAAALLKVLKAPRSVIHNQVFNIGSDAQNHTIQQVGEIVKQVVPEAVLLRQDIELDQRNYRVDFGKFTSTIGFLPGWTVEMGVRQVVNAIQNGRVTDYRDARYSNVRYLEEEGLLELLQKEHRWAYGRVNGEKMVDIPGMTEF
jgi:nucleoside-diphosphate-sugar epimerase